MLFICFNIESLSGVYYPESLLTFACRTFSLRDTGVCIICPALSFCQTAPCPTTPHTHWCKASHLAATLPHVDWRISWKCYLISLCDGQSQSKQKEVYRSPSTENLKIPLEIYFFSFRERWPFTTLTEKVEIFSSQKYPWGLILAIDWSLNLTFTSIIPWISHVPWISTCWQCLVQP